MKYFLDTEFIEGFYKPTFGKRRHYIDLISIGVVCEDGREYYAISNEYRYSDASNWVKENVIRPMYEQSVPGFKRQFLYERNFHISVGKSNHLILMELMDFFKVAYDHTYPGLFAPEDTQVYGYYSDYDWVLFCSLFGKMIELPKGFPMYCIDLKQTLDEVARNNMLNIQNKHRAESRFETTLRVIKNDDRYPKQTNEHNALADARWNMQLYNFLQKGYVFSDSDQEDERSVATEAK
jgi:hypothetical protein